MANLIAQPAPDFTAWAVMEDNTINQEFKLSSFKGKYIILFFYPLDFTFVCPTEILAYNEKLAEFKKRDAEIIGVSVDSVHSHLAWKKTSVDNGGIGPIQYPLVSDLTRSIGRAYDVLLDDTVAIRALFLIDREGIIKHATLNEDALGRNVTETLRTLDALRHYDEYGKVCPANWEKDSQSLDRSTESVVDYLSKFAKKN
jgi:peroxiredoxin (alkyl hydroperoxide reductase subunit C)